MISRNNKDWDFQRRRGKIIMQVMQIKTKRNRTYKV